MRKKFAGAAGFTIIELIVVIAILSILAGIAVPGYSAYIQRANDAAINAELQIVVDAAAAAAALAGADVYRIVVRSDGEITAYIPETLDDDGITVRSLAEIDISDFYPGTIDGLDRHSDYGAGCVWMGRNGAWVAAVDDDDAFLNPSALGKYGQ